MLDHCGDNIHLDYIFNCIIEFATIVITISSASYRSIICVNNKGAISKNAMQCCLM